MATPSRVALVKGNRTFIEGLPDFRSQWQCGFWEFVPQSPFAVELVSGSCLAFCPSVLFRFLGRRGAVTGGHGEARLWNISSGGLASAFRSLVRASRKYVDKSFDFPMYPHQCKKLAVFLIAGRFFF